MGQPHDRFKVTRAICGGLFKAGAIVTRKELLNRGNLREWEIQELLDDNDLVQELDNAAGPTGDPLGRAVPLEYIKAIRDFKIPFPLDEFRGWTAYSVDRFGKKMTQSVNGPRTALDVITTLLNSQIVQEDKRAEESGGMSPQRTVIKLCAKRGDDEVVVFDAAPSDTTESDVRAPVGRQAADGTGNSEQQAPSIAGTPMNSQQRNAQRGKGAKSGARLETAFKIYTLEQPIGEGGAGRVWSAVDSAGEIVAVKMLKPESATAERRKRFQNEIAFCSKVRHPNVVCVVDYGTWLDQTGVTPFFVMHKYSGSLRDLLQDRQGPAERLAYFHQVLNGVEAAHLKGVTHRDLKPENVLHDSKNGRLVVADFGIAHFTDEELYTSVETNPNARLANFIYAAPEQKQRGKAVDCRTDIYALGLMLNELFTGDVPHGEGYKRVADVVPELAWLDDIVSQMLQADPGKRPQTVDDVKKMFIARKQDQVDRQRVSAIKNSVVPIGEEDDPLAIDGPKLVDFDWHAGRLTLILDRAVDDAWVEAFMNIGNYESLMGKGPDTFRFAGTQATTKAEERQVQKIIDYFKQWLPNATAKYRNARARERRMADEAERAQLQAEQAAIEARQRLRGIIRL